MADDPMRWKVVLVGEVEPEPDEAWVTETVVAWTRGAEPVEVVVREYRPRRRVLFAGGRCFVLGGDGVYREADTATGAALGEVWLDPQAQGKPWDSPLLPLGEALGQPMLDMFVRARVFRRGEVLVMRGDRDLFGRKPSKWSVEVEMFSDLAAAARHALAVWLRVSRERGGEGEARGS